MKWEKKICIRLTASRIVGAILTATTVVNLVIVGAVFGADPSPAAPTTTATLTTVFSTATAFIPAASAETTFASTQPPGITPTDALLPTQTSTAPPLRIVCVKSFYWPTYRVQSGDRLISISAATGSTTRELMAANCLTSEDIYAGQLLFVPRLPGSISTRTPIDTPSATATPTGTFMATSTNTPTATDTPSPTATDTPTATSPPPADLMVVVLQVTGPAVILPGQQALAIPIYVLIQNQGEADAEIFKLSAHFAGLSGKFVAPFTAPGQVDKWYPYSTAPLAAGREVTFTGTVSLPVTLQGQTIALSVLVDSCSGDEFMPAYCRVAESNENNNESRPWTVQLPSNNPPSVAITVPNADTSYLYGEQVLLSGSATDPEDGVLSGASLAWSNDGIPLGTGAEVDVTAYLNDACGASYTFALTATDRDGNTATATRKIDFHCPLN